MKKSTARFFLPLSLMFSIRFVGYLSITTFIYTLFVFIISNFSMIVNIISLHYSVLLKAEVLLFSFFGYFHALDLGSIVTLFLITLLFGINTTYLLLRSRDIVPRKKSGHTLTTVASMFTALASGCTICGISLFSTIGVGSFFIFLPSHKNEVALIALILLFVALYLNLKSQIQPCELPKNSSHF